MRILSGALVALVRFCESPSLGSSWPALASVQQSDAPRSREAAEKVGGGSDAAGLQG